MTEPASAGHTQPRAFLRVGGSTLARHQLAMARALECERIVCIARHFGADVIALQHEVERTGMQFHVVTDAHGLLGMVSAVDELLVFADGLIALPEDVAALLAPGSGVIVQPVDAGVAAGFERIDLDHAAAGAMRIPGRLVERLAELPGDCDVASALTRLALQGGIARRTLPADQRDGLRWRIIRDEADAHAIEPAWLDLRLREGRDDGLAHGLARAGVRLFGASLLHAGNGSRGLQIGGAALLALAVGLGWFGFATSALLLLALTWIVIIGAHLLRRFEPGHATAAPGTVGLLDIGGWGLDAALIAILVWNIAALPGLPLWQRFFAPVILVCMTHLVPRLLPDAVRPWLQDRTILGVLLAMAALAGLLGVATASLAAALAIAAVICIRITRV